LSDIKLTPGQTIAIVGLSADRSRPSFEVASAMQRAGFHIIPVNPRYAGDNILGERCVASLAEIERTVDIVDCFRKSEDMVSVAIDAVAMKQRPRVLWMQQGIRNAEARRIAEDAGIMVIEDHCIKIAYYSQQ
jgi:uncharacterized protein